MKHSIKFLLLTFVFLFSTPVLAKDSFKVCWSIYVGWMPWDYGKNSGIVKKWADRGCV